MNEFEKIICKLLNELGYEVVQKLSLNLDISAHLYKRENIEQTQYFVISTSEFKCFDEVDFNEVQKNVYDGIKELLKQTPAVDKNTSWLIGIESQSAEYDFSKILSMEENPYYFKKTVCPYSKEEVMDLLSELKGQVNYLSYLQQEVTKVKRFTNFYEGEDKVYGFVARLFIKLPVIQVPIIKQQKFIDLSKEIEKDICDKELGDIYKFLKENLEDKINMIEEDINVLHDIYYQEGVDNE